MADYRRGEHYKYSVSKDRRSPKRALFGTWRRDTITADKKAGAGRDSRGDPRAPQGHLRKLAQEGVLHLDARTPA